MLDSSISTEFYMYWEKVSKWKKKAKEKYIYVKKGWGEWSQNWTMHRKCKCIEKLVSRRITKK